MRANDKACFLCLLGSCCLFVSLFTASFNGLWWKEFTYRELDLPEKLAWVIAACYALFIRYAEIVGRDEHLCVPDYLNNDEQSDSGINTILFRLKLQFAAEVPANVPWDYAARVTAIPAVAVAQFRRKRNWLGNLNNGLWNGAAALIIAVFAVIV